MQSLKLIFLLFATVVVEHAVSEDDPRQIFDECAQANGLERNSEKMKQMEESFKKDEKRPPPSQDMSEEFLCTEKCVHEKLGLLSDGKFVIQKLKENKYMMHGIADDAVGTFLKCLAAIKVAECADMKAAFECIKASIS